MSFMVIELVVGNYEDFEFGNDIMEIIAIPWARPRFK